MQKNNPSTGGNDLKSVFAAIAIPVCLVVAFLIYFFILGNPGNFVDGDTSNHPIDEGAGKWLGTVYKGGVIVPINISLLLILITFTIERFLTLARAKGNGNVDNFLRRIKMLLSGNDINGAIAECDKQKGSVGNVVKAGLTKYVQVVPNTEMDKEQKTVAIQKEIEEATTLELPMLEKNLVIIATIASIATLMGLLGTVMGMIKAFSALAQAGAPDATALSTGISEALINTALGVAISALAIIMYNFFSTKIDALTYRIDEAGFTISQTFASNYQDKAGNRPA
ncbi:MAG: MotA/TolQ/ExbB proton channel family protein [Sphingobacteriales bacterium]|nr:MAG: MotA/TolQ/ExbB proton channel family protein [Sphingobacteriales bacterium]